MSCDADRNAIVTAQIPTASIAVRGSSVRHAQTGRGEQQLRGDQPAAPPAEHRRLEPVEQRRPDELEGVGQPGEREEADRLDVDVFDGEPGLQAAGRQRQRQAAREAEQQHRRDPAIDEDVEIGAAFALGHAESGLRARRPRRARAPRGECISGLNAGDPLPSSVAIGRAGAAATRRTAKPRRSPGCEMPGANRLRPALLQSNDEAKPPPYCRLRHLRRRHRCAVAALALALASPAGAQPGGAATKDGVEVGERSRVANLVSAEKIEGAAAQQYAQLLREAASKRALAPPEHPQLQAPSSHRRAHHPLRDPLQPARDAVEVGSQPDRLEADQRLLHAGRQDRVLFRNHRHAQADRRRGRDDHGPRDRARAARARPRARREVDDRAGRDDRRVAAVAADGLRRPGRAARVGGREAHAAEFLARGRDRGRHRRHGSRGPRRLRSARGRRAVAEDGRRPPRASRRSGCPPTPRTPGASTRSAGTSAGRCRCTRGRPGAAWSLCRRTDRTSATRSASFRAR